MKRGALKRRQKIMENIILYEKNLNFASLLHPINEEEQKKSFLSGKIKNPIFEYKTVNIPIINCPKDEENDELTPLYSKRIEYLLNMNELMQSVGKDKKFSTLSSKIFPFLETQIPTIRITNNNNESDYRLNDDEILKQFLISLKKYKIVGWTIKISKNISSRMVVNYAEKSIFIKKGIHVDDIELNGLIRHEIGCHVLRSFRGGMQKEPLLHIGTAKGRLFEEGVACYLENPEGHFRIFLRHFAVGMARNSSFREVWENIVNKGLSQEEAWSMTLRVKRGLVNTSSPGGFTRDALYAQAFLDMKKYIEKGGDITPLLSAAIHPDEISFLQKEASLLIYPETIQKRRVLMIGFRGKKSHIKTAKEKGVILDLLIDSNEMRKEYANMFENIHVLNDIFNWNEIEKSISKNKYDGVFTRFEDFTVLVSAVAEHLNLPAISFKDSVNFRNKYCMRQAFKKSSVPSAKYALISSTNNIEELIKKCGFPLIIKQISGIHSKYVAKVENKKELKKTINFFLESLKKETGTLHGLLKNYSESHNAPDHRTHLLLEECLYGEELTIDAFIVNGEIFFTPICKYVMAEEIGIKDHHLPIRIMPYDLQKNQRDTIFNTVKEALKALGADFCVTHTEVFFNPQTNKCEVIEVAARGGGFRAEMVKNTCGGDYDLGIVRCALGLYPNVLNTPKKYAAVVEVFSPENGILNAIDESCIQGRNDISFITWNKNIGDEVGRASDGKSFILKFLVSEKTYGKAKSTAEKLLKEIQKTIKTL